VGRNKRLPTPETGGPGKNLLQARQDGVVSMARRAEAGIQFLRINNCNRGNHERI